MTHHAPITVPIRLEAKIEATSQLSHIVALIFDSTSVRQEEGVCIAIRIYGMSARGWLSWKSDISAVNIYDAQSPVSPGEHKEKRDRLTHHALPRSKIARNAIYLLPTQSRLNQISIAEPRRFAVHTLAIIYSSTN